MFLSPRHNVDLRCYLVTGRDRSRPDDLRGIIPITQAAVRGGAGIIQVRSKPLTARALTELTSAVAHAVHEVNPRTRVVVDDRVDVAAALMRRGEPVHGAHIGQSDLPPRDARRILGPEAIVGLSAATEDEVAEAEELGDVIDYIGAGPYRLTPTKGDATNPLGIDGYRRVLAATHLPVVAIGDVTSQDAPELAQLGIAGLAVVRGIMHAEDPEAAARAIVTGFEDGKAKRT